LREIHPRKKRTLKSVPNIGVITGILLKTLKFVCNEGNNNINGALLLSKLAIKHDSLSIISWPCCYHYDSYSSNTNERYHGGGFESKSHFKF
jgi:hypothetical protein